MVFIVINISGCTHYYYVPNTHNVPLFQEKDEIRFSIGSSTSGTGTGTELQGAYAITNKIGIIANVGFTENSGIGELGEGHFFELGAGYFKPLGKNLVFESYGGLGFGKTEHLYANFTTASMNISRYFVQPSFGFTSKYFDAVISSRIAILNYSNIEVESNIPQFDMDQINIIQNNKSSALFEPAIIIRGGWKYVKLQFQYVRSTNLTSSNFPQLHYNFNISLYFSFAEKFQSHNQQGENTGEITPD